MRYFTGYKYYLDGDWAFESDIRPASTIIHKYFEIRCDGWIIARDRYAWNGSDYVADTLESQSASLVHDIVCQAVQLGLLDRRWKRQGDLEYYKQSTENGMSKARAGLRLIGIQLHAWDNSPPKGTVTAPGGIEAYKLKREAIL